MKKIVFVLLSVLLLNSSNKLQVIDYQGIGKYETYSPHCQEVHSNSEYTTQFSRGEKIIIIGVDDVTRDRLNVAKKTLEDFYGFQVNIKEKNVYIHEEYYFNNDKTLLNAGKFVSSFEPSNRVLFITNKKMYSSNVYCRGYTLLNGKVIVVKNDYEFMEKTIIHELGHTYGLEHCENKTCVMGIYNDNYDTGKLCVKCKTNINYR